MKIRVYLFIKKSKKILLIKESNPKYKKKWYLPGGTVKTGESLIEAAIRETKEEAGFDAGVNGICHIKYVTKPVTERGLYIYCTGRVLSGSVKTIADEHSLESQWFDMATVEKLELRGDLLELIYKIRGDIPVIATDQAEII
jgi:ADP-ribose pyrophosphatase YjhB (NUDIX family)